MFKLPSHCEQSNEESWSCSALNMVCGQLALLSTVSSRPVNEVISGKITRRTKTGILTFYQLWGWFELNNNPAFNAHGGLIWYSIPAYQRSFLWSLILTKYCTKNAVTAPVYSNWYLVISCFISCKTSDRPSNKAFSAVLNKIRSINLYFFNFLSIN